MSRFYFEGGTFIQEQIIIQQVSPQQNDLLRRDVSTCLSKVGVLARGAAEKLWTVGMTTFGCAASRGKCPIGPRGNPH